ncbi:MAG TPA: ABC transporter permease [Streptosporangiaceae bacterium]|nr:ABC transporter permease [Streptosporangiaceae bacterium]
MITYTIRRLVLAVVMLLIVTLVTFAIFFYLPRLAGQNAFDVAAQYVGKSPTTGEILSIEHKLGLNEPLLVQFWHFVRGVVAGAHYNYGSDKTFCPPPCFGYSFKNQQAVWPLLISRFPVTLSLAIGAAVIWLVAGVSTGVVSALRKGSIFDRSAMGVALAGVSLPIFFTGQVALLLFSFKWHLFPAGQYTALTQDPVQWARDLFLPWVTLAFLYAALYARLTRAGMLETMAEDYIRTARAKGLPERMVILKHALRSTLTPILTIFGLDLGLLLGGAFITEVVYSLPGIGQFAVLAVDADDQPEILGVTLFAAFFIVIANLVVDIMYGVVDPRVRY